jgi:hypothetical protein
VPFAAGIYLNTHFKHLNHKDDYLIPLGRPTQTWEVNSLSRCNSKLCIISSKDVPVGGLVGLNRQPHSEQPKPRKCSCSIHISLRCIAASVAAPYEWAKSICANLNRLSEILRTIEGRSGER